MKATFAIGLWCSALLLPCMAVHGQVPDARPAARSDNRYGPFGLFDNRSSYGKGTFPEPFLVDDSDLEVNEIRLDWFHNEAPGLQQNEARIEFEKGFGLTTLELEAPYLYNTSRAFDPAARRGVFSREQGFANVDFGARTPFVQFVSPDEFLDTTFGVGAEVGIPTNSPVGKNTELVPKLFNDTRIGDHFTFQAIIGYSWLLGSKPDGGTQTFEYGLDFGWTISHHELSIPAVEQVVPMFELSGETLANTPDAGTNMLTGNAAVRFNLRPVIGVQPRLGIGYVFPITSAAREELHWGIVTSFVFEW